MIKPLPQERNQQRSEEDTRSMTYPVPTQVNYSQEFMDAVLAVSQDEPYIQKLVAERNLGGLGLALKTKADMSDPTSEELIALLKAGQNEEALKRLEKTKMLRHLHQQWRDYNHRYNPGPNY